MKTLVIGLGSIGMRHSRNLRALGVLELVGVDPDPMRRQRFAKELGAEAHAELADGLASRPTLALVCSPNALHVSQSIACAEADCHLFIEKPLGVARTGVDDLIELVRAKRLYAHIGSNWKFHVAFRTMKQLLDNGAVGRVTGAQVLAGQWLPDWHPSEDYRAGYSARRDLGGGVVFDTHEFDYLTWLLGPAVDVKGFSVRSGALETETDDVACACLRLESGALATIHIDYIQRRRIRRYHISGDTGTIEWDLDDGRVRYYRAGADAPVDVAAPLGDVNDMYVAQTRNVLDAIGGSDAPVTPLSHAARVLDLQLALSGSCA